MENFLATIIGCDSPGTAKSNLPNSEKSKYSINLVLDSWHSAAAEANFEKYFQQMTIDRVFLGTHPTENWQNDEFRSFSKSYFEKGKAWSFTGLERNIYFSSEGNIAWFDELLVTQMGIAGDPESWNILHKAGRCNIMFFQSPSPMKMFQE